MYAIKLLSKKHFPYLPQLHFKIQIGKMNSKCSICLELLSTKDNEVKSTPCGHLFHSHCLEKAIQTNGNCPQCRKSCNALTKGPITIYMDADGTGSAQFEDKFFKLLQKAAEKGSLETYKMAIEDEDDKNPSYKLGQTPLHNASMYGHLDVVKYIMMIIEDKSPKCNYGVTPLHYAAYNGHLDVVKYIMMNIKDKSPKSNDIKTRVYCPLHDHSYSVMSLICGGMNVKFLKSENEKPPVIKSMIKCAPVRGVASRHFIASNDVRNNDVDHCSLLHMFLSFY